ncbi:MAG TPA: peptidylprolyl isomerase, partial [Edaphobacter sp.]|nr:peptidylprolyl isomerase [Edaphobacter sp.]
IEEIVFKASRGFITDPIRLPNGFLILKVEERYEAGQASFEEVSEQIEEQLRMPQMQPRVRSYLTKLRQDAFLEIRGGFVDSGAAPGKDTSWKDPAQLKPETVTKEEVASRRKRKLLWVIPAGHKTVKPEAPASEPASKPAAGAATEAAPASPAAPAPAPAK